MSSAKLAHRGPSSVHRADGWPESAQSTDTQQHRSVGGPFMRDHISPTFLEALSSGMLLWAAFPPLGLWPLAWIAPVFWLRLIRRRRLQGSHPYRAIYLAGLVHWLILVQWVRLPHWSTYFGWAALGIYLAFYLPLFIGLTRVAVHQMGLSLVISAPLVWTGLELVRGHFLTGFSLALLGHTQVSWIEIIQVADLCGAYGVSFVVMLVASCLLRAIPCEQTGWSRWPLAVATVMFASVMAYGYVRVDSEAIADSSEARRVQVALIQGSIDTEFGVDQRDVAESFAEYLQLSYQAVSQNGQLNLLVWPESMFTSMEPLVTHEDRYDPPSDTPMSAKDFRERIVHMRRLFESKTKWIADQLGVPLLVGTEALHFGPQSMQRYNSAVFIDPQGKLMGRYDKMHPVMFGEYVPFGEWLPWLYRLTPMSGGLTPGRGPITIEVGGLRFAPSICFENTVPHLIRGQVSQLVAKGQSPNVLVTLTNDGWFWGSSLLDLHLTCGVFRAVEMRMPMLVAANTGLSAWIDGDGRVRGIGPRRKTGIVLAHIAADPRQSVYFVWGDWLAGICFVFCLIVALAGLLSWHTERSAPSSSK